ncbi:alpha-E domain-containing protein [Acidipila sp. EB88]|uniref:alpha-E domain-containing protein n=1 Tax=Acidipila sp. EB88 TaxID=2305226 RepID=UPI000F5DCE08|nr:alpha-E domain-containing protein [Acidipila sp. EB88]RRA47186.1 alpha-E domain-containing protein [Acidipila sp. EB88]
MLSRVADSLYWMSRYLERAEHTVRMLDVNFAMTLDPSSTSEDVRWRRLLLALGSSDEDWNGDSHALVQKLTHDDAHDASIKSCIAAARENARQVREEISSEQWLQLNRMYHLVTENPQSARATPPDEFLAVVLDGLHLFQGVTDTTMSHGEGWHFIQVGRSIERASSIASLLTVYEMGVSGLGQSEPVGSHHFLEWIGLLRSCTAFEAYCNVYTADLTESQILEFLLLNKDFPHSVRYSIDRLRDALLALQQESGRLSPQELLRVAGRLQSALSFVEISDVLQGGVGEYLAMVLHESRRIHSLIYRDYIHYSVQTALAM